jgi:hypothetical protein
MDNTSEEDIQQKQNIIQTQIIDRNYDKNQFFDFCLFSKPENGDDLSNWSISDLNEVISQFIKQQNDLKQQKLDKEKEHKDTKAQAESIQLDINQFEKEPQLNDQTQKLPQNSIKSNIVELNCKSLEKSILNDKKITVIIQNPKPIETGFFSSNYITYEVITEEVGWSVRRRYSDFVWLRATLCKLFPRKIVPPMPNKKLGNRRFEVDFVEKRMEFLSKFMSSVVENETFKASEPLTAFLSLTDRAQFEYKMKEFTSFIPSQYVEDIKTLNGKIYLNTDADTNEKYYTNINNYFKLQYQLFSRLNYNLKNFYLNINAASKHLEDVQKDFEMLHLLNSKVQMKEEVTRSYEELGIFFKNWSRMLYNQNAIIKTHIKHFFKYNQMECLAYEELIKSRDEIRIKYSTENARLVSKKDKLWAAMDVSKWEITEDYSKIDRLLLIRDKQYAYSKMCTTETQMVENLKKQLCYANRSNIDELKRLIAKNCLNFVVNLKKFCDEMYPSLNDGLTVWTGLMTYAEVL